MSVSLEVKDTKSQNKRNSEPVNLEVFKLLKQVYADKFNESPSELLKQLDKAFSDENTPPRRKDGSGGVIADKTIRNFISADEPTTASTKTLNYLCKVMLGYSSYGEAIRSLDAKDEKASPKSNLPESDDSQEVGLQENLGLRSDWLEAYRRNVRQRWGAIKVLDMEESLSLKSIYAGTYFLKSIKGRRQLEYEDLFAQSFDNSSTTLNDYKYQEERVSGLEKIKEKSKLIILGSGGSGKTSFLRYLALRYLDSQVAFEDFGVPLTPVYIPLKVWAKEIVLDQKKAKSGVAGVITDIFEENIPDSPNITKEIQNIIEKMLKDGQFLILFDALDESGQHIDEVGRVIRDFTNKYSKNRVVLTSRLQTTERQFDGFAEVEIASFTEEQVADFAEKWFTVRKKSKLAQRFLEQRRANPAISNLTANPLSLTYLCLVFRDNLGFPKNKSGIYENVVDIFLRKWDSSRDIDDRIPVADRLSSGRKFLLFRQIAYQGMIQKPPQFIWKEQDLKAQIRKFMEKVSTTREEDIDQDTNLVLQVVIRDHGLLVPQSRNLYGFPFRTLQEYFTAKDICGRSNNDSSFLEKIVREYLTDREWKNVFLMVAELIEDADEMFRFIFYYVNALAAKSEALQKMLIWLHQITQTLEIDSSSWRALWLAIDLDTESILYINHEIGIEKLYAQQTPVVMKAFNKERNKIVPNNPKLISALYLIVAHSFAIDKAHGNELRLRNSSDYIKNILVVDENTTTEMEIELAINEAKNIGDFDPVLIDDLKSLQKEQPLDSDTIKKWELWSERLRFILLRYFNIGHQVIFCEEDKKALENYIYANNLLVKCLTGDSLSTRSLREKIFDHILLPIDSIPDNLRLNPHL